MALSPDGASPCERGPFSRRDQGGPGGSPARFFGETQHSTRCAVPRLHGCTGGHNRQIGRLAEWQSGRVFHQWASGDFRAGKLAARAAKVYCSRAQGTRYGRALRMRTSLIRKGSLMYVYDLPCLARLPEHGLLPRQSGSPGSLEGQPGLNIFPFLTDDPRLPRKPKKQDGNFAILHSETFRFLHVNSNNALSYFTRSFSSIQLQESCFFQNGMSRRVVSIEQSCPFRVLS